MNKCPKCGVECEENQKFCFNCGCKFEEKKSNKVLLLFCLVVAICLGLFMFFERSTKTVAVKGTDFLAAVKVEDKWGYINTKGEMVIEPRFKYAYSFSNGYAVVRDLDANTNSYKYGVINKYGDYVIKPKYANIYMASKGLNIFEAYDVVYPNVVIPTIPHKYIDLEDKVLFGGKLFAYDSEILPYISFVGENEYVMEYKEMKSSKFTSYRNPNGKEIFRINDEEEKINGFPSKNFNPVYCKRNGEYYNRYIINDRFEKVMVLPNWKITNYTYPDYFDSSIYAGGFSCGRCVYCVREGRIGVDRGVNTYRVTDEKGNIIKELKFNLLRAYVNGYARFEKIKANEGTFYDMSRESGFLDKDGNVVMCCDGKNTECLTWDLGDSGLIAIKKNGKCGYVNIKGEEIIPCQYDDTRDFGR